MSLDWDARHATACRAAGERDAPGTPDEGALFEQVRRLRVHDDVHGGYVPVVIGYWDQRGYTHCPACLPDPSVLAGRTDPIYGDNCAAEGGRCDSCGVSLLAAALDRHAPTARNH